MSVAFRFHAAASAASGHITMPFHEQIEVAASAALPPGGGYASARVRDFRHRSIISFKEAYSYVTGSETPNSFETCATSVVTGLNILDVLTADRVVARLTSSRPKERNDAEVAITPLGSHFENLRIAGRPVPGSDRLLTGMFDRLDTFRKMKGPDESRQFTADDQAKEKLDEAQRLLLHAHLRDVMQLDRETSSPLNEKLRRYFPHAGSRGETSGLFRTGVLNTSLMPNLENTMDDFDSVAFVVPVRHFGVVRICEKQALASQRRLTMLSVTLGCPFEGSLDLCFAESNGSIWT